MTTDKSKETPPLIIVDTREQLPYHFPGWPVVRRALKTGDYTIAGMEDVFAIERKSMSDLLGCIFAKRFHNELDRLRDFKHAFLVVECNLSHLNNPPHYEGNPASVIGMLQAIELKYDVRVKFLNNRDLAEAYVRGLLAKYHKYFGS